MTSTYNSSTNTIEVINGINTIDNVFTNINNPNVLSKSYNTYILNANMTVMDGATLYINDSVFNINNEFRLWGKGGSRVSIDNSTLTGGRILMRRESLAQGLYHFSLKNSTVQLAGGSGVDEFGESKYPLFLYPRQDDNYGDGNKHAGSTVYFTNNIFLNGNIVTGDLGDYGVVASGNTFRDNSAPYTLTFFKGELYNNTFYNLTNIYHVVYIYGDPYTHDNIFKDISLQNSGRVIMQKEGSGGAIIENNTINNITTYISSDTAVAIEVLGSHHHTTWGSISNNTITNSPRLYAISIQGNGYNDGGGEDWDVRFVVENNTINSLLYGIYYSGYSNMGQNRAPKNVVTRNNKITNSNVGFYVNGINFYNVSSNNDSMIGNGYDLWIGQDYIDSSYPPFINTQYSTIAIKTPTTLFKNYKYLDIKVVDINNTPISNAIVTITNNTDINYPPINIEGQTKTSFTTGLDGHTPLPSNILNSIAIMNFYKTSSTQQEMNYNVSATYNNISNSISVTPDATWYRLVPDTYQNTVTIQLPVDIGCPIPICNINITQV